MVFNCARDLSVVKVSTLVEQLDSAVRDQARFLFNKAAGRDKVEAVGNSKAESDKVEAVGNSKAKSDKEAVQLDSKGAAKKGKGNVTRRNYVIGASLVNFMVERELIHLSSDVSFTEVPGLNKNGKGRYIPKNGYAMCNFDLSLLPIKLNLAMVCEPLPWESNVEFPKTLADLSGGYLSRPTFDIYNRFRIFTSRDLNHFNINLKIPGYERMCTILNNLQSQVFEINKEVLEFIIQNRDRLEELGLLMPRNLANVNLREASDLLRYTYFLDKGVQDICSCNVLIMELVKRVQRARYEDFVITLAKAFRGFKMDFPAFMDFRGRIYRSGVLHFHERDLARSLLLFAGKPQINNPLSTNTIMQDLACATAFKYQKFLTLDEAYKWYKENQPKFFISDENLMKGAVQASEPFQFLAKFLFNTKYLNNEGILNYKIPVTQDASASAYQIMSYLLLNQEMGMRTNLLPSSDGQIQDVYMCLKEELGKFLKPRLESNKYSIIISKLTRKLVKGLFMPLIYGKTVMSMANEIKVNYDLLLSHKDSYGLALLCYEFWKNKYPDIVNLMKLLNLIGWFCSKLDKPVFYSIPYFTTVQDYMCSKASDIWLYDRVSKKRRRITLRVPTPDRDSRKTKVATCVNFIHQKDAYIAMKVVEVLLLCQGAQVYTVHENFITTAIYARFVPEIYTGVFVNMGAPLRLIIKYINMNLISWDFPSYMDLSDSPSPEEERLSKDSIHNRSLWVGDPIPVEDLRYILDSQVPKDISKTERIIWERNISATLSCYEEYCNTVCGEAHFKKPSDGGKRHAEKWKEFQADLERWRNLGFNY